MDLLWYDYTLQRGLNFESGFNYVILSTLHGLHESELMMNVD